MGGNVCRGGDNITTRKVARSWLSPAALDDVRLAGLDELLALAAWQAVSDPAMADVGMVDPHAGACGRESACRRHMIARIRTGSQLLTPAQWNSSPLPVKIMTKLSYVIHLKLTALLFRLFIQGRAPLFCVAQPAQPSFNVGSSFHC